MEIFEPSSLHQVYRDRDGGIVSIRVELFTLNNATRQENKCSL